MMNRKMAVILIVFALFWLSVSGCVEKEDLATATVRIYLEAKNISDYETASLVVDRDYQSAGYIQLSWRRVDRAQDKEIRNIEMTRNVSGNRAVVIANYTQIEYSQGSRNKIGEQNITQYFGLGYRDDVWWITEISSTPLPPPVATEKVEKPLFDRLADNAVYILLAALILLATGIYIDRGEKAQRAGHADRDAKITSVQTAQLSRFVRCVPSQMKAGSLGTVDVWIKNLGKQPYQNLVVTGTFSDVMRVKNKKLKFGTLEPGQTAKQTWKITPAAPGRFSINEVTVAFTLGGKRHAGILDPVWIQVT